VYAGADRPSGSIAVVEAQGSFERLCSQLQIAFRTLYERHLKALTEDLWEFILDEHIDSNSGFDALAERSRYFLPDFFPLKISELPYVAVLAYGESDDQLSIRGATEVASKNAPVDVDQSVTGMLIRDRKNIMININPRDDEYTRRYRRYFVRHVTPVREVAIKLDGRGTMQGVLNFEFLSTRIFSVSHEEFLLAARKPLSLLFCALETRWQNELQSAKSQEATTQAYMNTFAKALRHELLQFTSAITMHAHAATKTNDIPGAMEALSIINDINANIVDLTNRFTKDASMMSKKTNLDAKDLFVKVRRFFLAGKKTEIVKTPFGINIRVPDGIILSLPRLIEIWINALFENSFKSFISKRSKDVGFHGIVDVSYSERTIDTNQLSIEYHVLTIADNGLGVSEKRLRELNEGKPIRSDRGLGYALFGLGSYMRGLGGFLELDSVEHKTFVVRLGFRKPRFRDVSKLQ